ncbi:MAG: FAD-dependent oxidoreductase [Bacteroidota bacterium]
MKDQQHIVVVGGGLAGTFMALRLVIAGHQVSLFDRREAHTASMVAAGMYNVITGRFGAKSWLADRLLQEIDDFFGQEGIAHLKQYVHPSLIYRPFKTYEEYNKWTSRSVDPDFAHLVTFFEDPIHEDIIENPFGGIKILPCGWVDTVGFIQAAHQWLDEQEGVNIFPWELGYEQIELEKRKIERDGMLVSFDQIVFAQGPKLGDNPFFPEIKIIPNKGEILRIQLEGAELPFTLSKKIYMISQGNHQYIVGSTYQNSFEHPFPTEEGRQEIESFIRKAIRIPYKVLEQKAGIRPTTPNRRPVVGTHPLHSFVHAIGGFGTKGILLGPYCSRLLVQKMFAGVDEIPEEAKLERFSPPKS